MPQQPSKGAGPRSQGRRFHQGLAVCGLALFLLIGGAPAAPALDTPRVDAAAQRLLQELDVPSLSLAIVQEGRLVYQQAYGLAAPERPATVETRYEIGSVSKQFLALALLLLQQDGRLRLDDPAGQHLSGLGAAAGVTLRQLLDHTGGLRDYWPQDYVPAPMRRDIEPAEIVRRWTQAGLDFEPGTRFEYSNTGYVLAALVLEKVSGQTLAQFLQRRIFEPLEMHSAAAQEPRRPGDALGHTRIALGPLRPAPRLGQGWLQGAGQLSMTAADLARWNISLMQQSLARPDAYAELTRATLLRNGLASSYALGLGVRSQRRQRLLSHDGGSSGFLSVNLVYPELKLAITVLSNSDAADAVAPLADELARLLLPAEPEGQAERLQADRQMLEALRQGRIERSRLSENANAYFSPEVLREHEQSLAGLGALRSFKRTDRGQRGGMDFQAYAVEFESQSFELLTRALPDGRLEQFRLIRK